MYHCLQQTKEGEGFLSLQISVVKRNTTTVTGRESGSCFTIKIITLHLNLHGTESVTFPPSFPAAPGRPWSPGGPGDPGCPLSPLGPVPPVGPCGQHETAIKYLLMLHPREDEGCGDNFSDHCLIHLDYIQTSQQAQQRIGENPLTVNVLCLYLWSNHPSRSWWSCFSLETLERKRDATD